MPACASSRWIGAGHEVGRVGVGLREVHLHVLVEHRLARAAICCGGWAAMCWASAIVSWSSLSGGATRLTSPSRSAVAASIDWPVNSMSSARLEPTLRPTGTEGVPQNRPLLMPEVAKVASRRGDGEIAGGDELAAGGRGDGLDLGDHRLRQAADRHHHGRAARQQVVVEGVVAARRDLAQVVAGREGAARWPR